MSQCRIFCGQNGQRFYIEATMHASYDNVIIALNFTHEQQMCYYFSHIDYGLVTMCKDTVNVTDIIDAFNKANNEYDNCDNIDVHNYGIKIKYSSIGMQLMLYNIKNDTPPLVWNVIECDKQKYYDCFIESLKQT